jgi:uncharacterized membrane protein
LTDQHTVPLACPACRVIDQADGVEDGNLYATISRRIKHESAIMRDIKRVQDKFADAITTFAGSMNFVYLHSAWFVIWIAINLGIVGAALAFDKFPFGLLTMIVSLEAIFLSTFVMISQNRQASRADVRAKLDFETNLRAEIWSVHIGQALGVDPAHVEQVVTQAIEGSRKELGDEVPAAQ